MSKRKYLRDERGRFAPGQSSNKRTSSRKRSPNTTLGLNVASTTSKRLLASDNKHARGAGAALNIATHVARHPAVRKALRDITKHK